MNKENNKETKSVKKGKVGIVVSDKMDKTVVVKIDRLKMHAKYKKKYKVSKKYKAHDAGNEFKIGDKVEIMEVKPMSKEKKWVARRVESL
ncbi:MAG: 30S ribosomal protein S17 [Patescibacteria group bacterium]|nr:30S ribosomal protein S17 [Patescibacteria group bacterium]